MKYLYTKRLIPRARHLVRFSNLNLRTDRAIDRADKIAPLIGGARGWRKARKARGSPSNQTPGEVVNNDWTPTSWLLGIQIGHRYTILCNASKNFTTTFNFMTRIVAQLARNRPLCENGKSSRLIEYPPLKTNQLYEPVEPVGGW